MDSKRQSFFEDKLQFHFAKLRMTKMHRSFLAALIINVSFYFILSHSPEVFTYIFIVD